MSKIDKNNPIPQSNPRPLTKEEHNFLMSEENSQQTQGINRTRSYVGGLHLGNEYHGLILFTDKHCMLTPRDDA